MSRWKRLKADVIPTKIRDDSNLIEKKKDRTAGEKSEKLGKNLHKQQIESLVEEGKWKRTAKAPTAFFQPKSLELSSSLQERSTNMITTEKVVNKSAILPDHSYCAAPPADSSSREPDHVKDRGDEMEEFGIFPIKVEDLQSDGPEDVGREETQMMGMLAAQCPQVLNSMQDLGSELQELQQEFEQTQHSDRDTVDRLEGKRRHLYRFVDEAVDLVKIRVNKKQKEKFYLLDKQMECLQQAKSTRQRALQGREDISFVQGYMDLGKKGLESASQFQSMKISLFSVLDISQEEKNLDLLIKLNSNTLQKIQNIKLGVPSAGMSWCPLKIPWYPSQRVDGESLNLDLNSAHPLIVISQDLKTATRTGTKHLHSEHPDRFNVYPQVLSSECFSFGHHYWEVDVSLSHWCRIGVAFNSLGRKGSGKRCGLGENHESWCIEKYHNEYSAWHNDQQTPLSVWGDLERFGFLLDCEVGELMCFGDSRVLHVFKGTFTDPIKAAIGVYNYIGDSVRFCSL